MSGSSAGGFTPGQSEVPLVLVELSKVLPEFEAGPDLEGQLQNFDYFLANMGAEARWKVVSLLRDAAAQSASAECRARIETAADAVARGDRAAEPYNHEGSMRKFREEHRAAYAKKEEPSPTPGPASETVQRVTRGFPRTREVDYGRFEAAVRKAGATHHAAEYQPGGGGEPERWIDREGRVVGWVNRRYFHGEEEVHYFLNTWEKD